MNRLFKYRVRILIYFLVATSNLLVFSCGKNNSGQIQNDSIRIIGFENEMIQENLEDRKGELYMLVEGAVDSWFFYHLHDYRSYEPIIRSTDYNAEEDYYIHKCRYRASTLGGGFETEEKIFKVTFDIDSQGMKDFHVEDITGHKSLTEKDD